MNKYEQLFRRSITTRNYTKFEDMIFKNNISGVFFKNPLNRGFLERLNLLYIFMINLIKKYKTFSKISTSMNETNFD